MTPFNGYPLCAAVAMACTAILVACGGGGGSPGTTTPPTAAQAATVVDGPLMGYGSVIVNGVRFSTVGASMQDDDGQSVNLSQLKLGMTLRVDGDADDATARGSASKIELVHGNRGAVTAIDVPAGTLTVLGQTVKTNSATAFQGAAGLAALTVGQVVEVYGVLQPDGSLLATLIEVKAAVTSVSLIGRISSLGGTSFKVGNLTVNYATAVVTGVLGDGKRVRVKATSGPVANVLTATSVKVSGNAWVNGGPVTTGASLKLKGVADAAPVDGLLTVSGTPVDVSKAVIRGGNSIAAGALIEVKGTWDGSSLQASVVEIEGFREHDMGGRNELFGAVSSVTGNIVVVDGVTVDLTAAVFSNGTLAQVVVGSYVEIKGNLVGTTLMATRVELKTGSGAVGLGFEQFGPVTDFVSSSNFKVNGMLVDASKAVFVHGSAANLANGVYVEINGAKDASGTFLATKVEIESKKAS